MELQVGCVVVRWFLMCLIKMLNFRNSVLETIKTQKKMENPVEPTYSHEDAVARAFMASNLIANIFLGNEGDGTGLIYYDRSSRPGERLPPSKQYS